MRIFTLVLATALLGLATFAPAYAQDDAASDAQEGTASVSGRVVVTGGGVTVAHVFVVPAGTPQPIDAGYGESFRVPLGEGGEFSVSGLARGDFLIAVPSVPAQSFVTPMPETVTFVLGQTQYVLPAIRVSLVEAQSLTGIEIVIQADAPVVSDDFGWDTDTGLSLPSALAPDTGAGPDEGDRSAAYIGASVVAVTALLAGGGLALRLRRRRAG